mmetsp:Transcript_36820/g.92269  ORF Transcript_36820/g.92269 Transcript_36820/m.92269 type:complete len:327 (+) Transcript_36820:1427-2407(+)
MLLLLLALWVDRWLLGNGVFLAACDGLGAGLRGGVIRDAEVSSRCIAGGLWVCLLLLLLLLLLPLTRPISHGIPGHGPGRRLWQSALLARPWCDVLVLLRGLAARRHIALGGVGRVCGPILLLLLLLRCHVLRTRLLLLVLSRGVGRCGVLRLMLLLKAVCRVLGLRCSWSVSLPLLPLLLPTRRWSRMLSAIGGRGLKWLRIERLTVRFFLQLVGVASTDGLSIVVGGVVGVFRPQLFVCRVSVKRQTRPAAAGAPVLPVQSVLPLTPIVVLKGTIGIVPHVVAPGSIMVWHELLGLRIPHVVRRGVNHRRFVFFSEVRRRLLYG